MTSLSSPSRPRARIGSRARRRDAGRSLDTFHRSMRRSLPLGLRRLHGLAEATSVERQRHWRCSRWRPSSCSWPRWLPPQASRSSHSDGSASSACSPPSARRRSRYVSCCCPTARSSDTIAAVIGTIAGLALWIVFAPTLESAVDHRIDRLSLPWSSDRDDRRARRPRSDRRRVVAGANGRPPPGRARTLGKTSTAEAGTPLGYRGRRADRSRRRLSRTVRPRQPSAHRRRARRDDPRHVCC